MARSAALIAMTFLSAGAARADFDAEAFPPYEGCALCHGLHGVSANARFPHLGGQDPVYLENQLRAFLSGDRHNDGGQMAGTVAALDPADLPVVVDWFAAQEPPAPSLAAEGGPPSAAEGCGDCHDTGAAGVPHLTAQHAGYLAKQMRDFHAGLRPPHPEDAPLPGDDDAIEAIAAYLASVPRP